MNFYEVLPEKFTTEEYRKSADLINLSAKTAEKYTSDYIKLGLLERIEHGHYRKVG